jgi:hypothetical protein
MNHVLIELAEGNPIGGKVFPYTDKGKKEAVAYGALIAAENSTVDSNLVKADLEACGEFEDGGWSIKLVTMRTF